MGVYVVAHAEKYSIKSTYGLGIHVDRKTENHSNKNIDNAISSENVELVENYKNNLYNAVKQRINEGYKKEKAIRKDAVATIGVVCSASPDFFKNNSKAETVQYFKDCKEYFENKIGKENIVCAKIHFDETTPHMHLYFVPLTEDGRLSAKEICNREFLRNLQKELPVYLQEKGHKVERGLEDSVNEHISKKEYEINLRKEELLEQKQRLSDEEKKIEEKKKSLTLENEKLYNLDNVLKHVEEKKKLFKNEIMVSMDKEIYKSLVKYAREGEKYLKEAIALEEKAEKLEKEKDDYFLRNKSLSDRNMLLETKKIDLQLELQKYKTIGSVLQELGYEKALEECLTYSTWKNGNWKEKEKIKKNILGKDEKELNRAEKKILKSFEKNVSWEKKVNRSLKNRERDTGLER